MLDRAGAGHWRESLEITGVCRIRLADVPAHERTALDLDDDRFSEPRLRIQVAASGGALIDLAEDGGLLRIGGGRIGLYGSRRGRSRAVILPGGAFRMLDLAFTAGHLRRLLGSDFPSALEPFFPVRGEPQFPGLNPAGTPALDRIAHEVFGAVRGPAAWRAVLFARATEALAETLLLLERVRSRAPVPSDALRIAHRARDLLLADLAAPEPLERIAARVGCSRPRLTRLFTAAFGSKPSEYLRHYRLEAARRLIEDGTTPLKQIAALAGYSHVNHLTTAFRLRYGRPPGAHRRAVLQPAPAKGQD